MRRTVGRRAFLMGTAGVVGGASVAVPAVATSADEWHSVDFERLVESTFASLPDDSSDLRDGLATLAGAIHQELSPVTERAIRQAAKSVSKASSLARRTQYAIDILHNNDLARYLDDAWVATFRSKIGVVTRFLPLVGGFNNLYHHAEVLDTAVENNWFISGVDGEKFENFGYSLAAFALEVGLWWFGAPFKMAWKGTRFVSNRTLLRALNYLDNRLVALVMSEIH
jgi:hypothetical protein